MVATVGVARGDSLTLRLQPGFQATETRVRDASGARQTGDTQLYDGLYQLSLQKDLYESIRFSGSGTLQDTRGTATANQVSTDVEAQTWNADGTLTFGQEVLNGAIGYLRSNTSSSTRTSTDPFVLVQPSIVRETWFGAARWAPLDLPSLEARLSRDTVESVGIDQRTLLAALSSAYQPIEQVRLSGALNYTNGNDQLVDVETSSLAETVTATYGDSFFGRTTVFAQGQMTHAATSTRTSPTSGPVRTQRFAVEGLSLVEGFTDQPERDTLRTNTLVIDGDLNTGAGLNIGFGPTLPPTNDQAFRDVGARFVERAPVNLIEVWVDKRLPTGVSSAFVWTVYRSDDNLAWTAVQIAGPVVFHPVENRFEIPFVPTVSPFLKVVTRPISSSVTPDPAFRDINITELRTFFVQPAEDIRGETSAVGATVSAGVGTRILDVPNLRHDLSAVVATANWEDPTTQVTNGLALAHRLSPKTAMSANVIRSDGFGGGTHTWRLQWGASLTATPLPTLTSGASYSGFLGQDDSLGNGVSVFGRAALYPGIDFSGNSGYNLVTSADDRNTRSVSASGSIGVVPVRWLNVSGGGATSDSRSSGGGLPSQRSRTTRLDATTAFYPFAALYFSAGISRIFGTSITPRNLLSFAANYSPFREGALLLSFAHSQNVETSTNTRSRVSSASSRWNFASWGYLEANYALLDTETPQIATDAQSISALLSVTM